MRLSPNLKRRANIQRVFTLTNMVLEKEWLLLMEEKFLQEDVQKAERK
jgi:hypothetical protein